MTGYECWAWVVREHDGKEGVVAVRLDPADPLTHTMGMMLICQSRNRDVAESVMGVHARRHAEAAGLPVRLVHLVEAS